MTSHVHHLEDVGGILGGKQSSIELVDSTIASLLEFFLSTVQLRHPTCVKMPGISWEKIASSKPYTFFVGPTKREFTLHSALVASLSPALDKLVNGPFKEAAEGKAELRDVDEQTFIRFTEFAYTGDYAEIPFLASHLDWCNKMNRANEGGSTRSQPLFRVRRQDSTSTSSKLWGEFKSTIRVPSNFEFHTKAENRDGGDDFAEVFLFHARLFVFADCYGISKLMELSLRKLGRALAALELDNRHEGAKAVVRLLQYCFDNPTPESLRSLVLLYTACVARKIWPSSTFQDFFKTHDDFKMALMATLVEALD
ncbi:hypothetical protein VTK56DRAFT_5836 [Thermocarpiscus australiensis]